MSRAKRKFWKAAADAAGQEADAQRADLPWYMQRTLRAALAAFLRGRRADPMA